VRPLFPEPFTGGLHDELWGWLESIRGNRPEEQARTLLPDAGVPLARGNIGRSKACVY
jgi:hypothetical protein